MRPLADELAELDAAIAELRARVAEALRELAFTVLAVVSTPRALAAVLALIGIAALAGWLVVSMIDTWAT